MCFLVLLARQPPPCWQRPHPFPPCLCFFPQVLVTSAGRVRIGSLGVPEALAEAGGYQDVPQVG